MTDTAEITLYFHRETDKAILVGESCMSDDTHIWLPKSQISYAFTGKLDHGTRQVTIEAPEWLLVDKGLEGLV